jgi:hypothetical protein
LIKARARDRQDYPNIGRHAIGAAAAEFTATTDARLYFNDNNSCLAGSGLYCRVAALLTAHAGKRNAENRGAGNLDGLFLLFVDTVFAV